MEGGTDPGGTACPSRNRLPRPGRSPFPEPHPARPSRESREPHGSRADRPKRPAPLLFEPGMPDDADGDRFFELESMDDPRQLLARATELEQAFRTAADRASEFQAIAAAQLTDPRRFDR